MLYMLSVVAAETKMLLIGVIWNTYGKNKMYGKALSS